MRTFLRKQKLLNIRIMVNTGFCKHQLQFYKYPTTPNFYRNPRNLLRCYNSQFLKMNNLLITKFTVDRKFVVKVTLSKVFLRDKNDFDDDVNIRETEIISHIKWVTNRIENGGVNDALIVSKLRKEKK